MDRRNFLRTLVGGVAGAAAVRTWPFRVYSFPSEIITPPLEFIDYSKSIAINIPGTWAGMDELIKAAYAPAIKKQLQTTSLLWDKDVWATIKANQ